MLELNEIHNPFPGIRPFEMDETNLFFGRDGQSDELLKRLQHTRLLAVVGTSGSGKSSLIRAGLLPALFGGLMGDAGSSWRIAIHRPGGDPVGNLAAALADRNVFGLESDSEIQTTLIETTLRRSSIGLIDVARQARMAEHENLLVVVDQFEELFRFKQAQSGDDATVFVKLLLEASAQQEIPIYIIITMRSDFLGDCSQFTGLPEAINNGQYLIPRMSRDERQSAIVGPIAVGQGQITAPLVSRLLNDVGDNPDQLPILQHALMRTWNYWSAHRLNGNPIGLGDYLAIGTMAEALSRHADEAFNELPDERSRLIAEKLFKRLTEKGTDNREIRRPTRLDELCAVCEATQDEVSAIIDVFRREGRSFLMPPAGARLTGETVIDISHESLIRNWARLQQWVDEEAQSSRTYRRLAEAAVLHREGSEGLLQDPGLQIALDWLAKSKPNEAWARRYHSEFDEATKYLAESRLAREAAQHEREQQRNAELERERREREQAEIYAAGQAKAARRLRLYLVAVVVLALFALAGTASAVVALRNSKKNEAVAEDARFQAEQATKREIESLENERAARSDADEQKKRAEAEKKYAEDQKKLADARATEAEQARKQAVASAAAAVAAQKVAEKEATKNKKARKANDDFREAALDVQRGKSDEARNNFSSAIKRYRDPDVANDEGVADASVEMGSLALADGRRSFAQFHNYEVNDTMRNLDMTIVKYDEAAKIYASPTVNALDKAAATNFSLAMNLLPFANGTLARSPAQHAASDSSGWTGAEGELPRLRLPTRARVDSGPFMMEVLNYDPVTKLKNVTVKHLTEALLQYRQVFEEHKNKPSDSKTETARVGMRKAAYQLGDFFLKLANEESTNHAYKTESDRQKAVDYERRQAVFYLEDLLSTYETNDVERGQLLIWLGGLHQSLGKNSDGEKAVADKYFERALAALKENGWWPEADALGEIGDQLNANGQVLEAVDFYQKAGVLYTNTGDRARSGDMYYNCGRVYEEMPYYSAAHDSYVNATSFYKKAFEEDKTDIGVENVFTAGAFLEKIGADGEALEAFDLAIKIGAKTKRQYLQIDLARAYRERGEILSRQKKPSEALDAYRHAIIVYDEMQLSDVMVTDELRNQAVTERERVALIVKALENELRAPVK